MGIDTTFGKAFFKAELAAGTLLPTAGTVFLSLADGDKPAGLVVAQRLRDLGLGVAATRAPPTTSNGSGSPSTRWSARSPTASGINAVELIESGEIAFVINTPQGRGGRTDGEQIRKAANSHRVSSVTTVEAALAAVQGMQEMAGQRHRRCVRCRSITR